MKPIMSLPFGTGTIDIEPSKVIALGLNYRDHIQESVSVKVRGFDPVEPEEPVVFPKLPSAIIGPGASIVIPEIVREYAFADERTDYEGELALIVAKDGRNIPVEQAMEFVLGFTCANDVSNRNIQNGDRSGWFRGKSFDTFLPLGPRVVPLAEIGDPQSLSIETRLNGTVVQTGSTSQMIFPIAEMIAWISRNFTLREGDIILTGTPSGVGPLHSGDVVEVEIQGVGILSNPVVAL